MENKLPLLGDSIKTSAEANVLQGDLCLPHSLFPSHCLQASSQVQPAQVGKHSPSSRKHWKDKLIRKEAYSRVDHEDVGPAGKNIRGQFVYNHYKCVCSYFSVGMDLQIMKNNDWPP